MNINKRLLGTLLFWFIFSSISNAQEVYNYVLPQSSITPHKYPDSLYGEVRNILITEIVNSDTVETQTYLFDSLNRINKSTRFTNRQALNIIEHDTSVFFYNQNKIFEKNNNFSAIYYMNSKLQVEIGYEGLSPEQTINDSLQFTFLSSKCYNEFNSIGMLTTSYLLEPESSDTISTYTYNYQNKNNILYEVELKMNDPMGNRRATFKYDSKNRVISFTEYYPNLKRLEAHTFIYGKTIFPIKSSYTEKDKNNKVTCSYTRKYKYVFDQTGNWIKKSCLENGNITSTTLRSFEYHK